MERLEGDGSMQKHFIDARTFEPSALLAIIALARRIKEAPSEYADVCAGKTLGMIFHKPSTRTRISFQVGIHQLGGVGMYFSASDLQLGRGETIADTARVLSRYLDGVMIRTFDHADVETLATHSTIPIINGLTDFNHPCQAMADLMTIREKKGRLEGITLTYVGDGNNVLRSLVFQGLALGVSIRYTTPGGYDLDTETIELGEKLALDHNTSLQRFDDPHAAVAGADVVYTDVWTSMGQEEEKEERMARFAPYQVNEALLAHAAPGHIFMHCLPAHRGEEVTDAVADGPASVIFDQAENRLHAQKAIMAVLMGGLSLDT
jgi:ornithine carbamoyltransferase